MRTRGQQLFGQISVLIFKSRLLIHNFLTELFILHVCAFVLDVPVFFCKVVENVVEFKESEFALVVLEPVIQSLILLLGLVKVREQQIN